MNIEKIEEIVEKTSSGLDTFIGLSVKLGMVLTLSAIIFIFIIGFLDMFIQIIQVTNN